MIGELLRRRVNSVKLESNGRTWLYEYKPSEDQLDIDSMTFIYTEYGEYVMSLPGRIGPDVLVLCMQVFECGNSIGYNAGRISKVDEIKKALGISR